MPQGFVLEYVALYLQIIRCRVADHVICPAVGEGIFPDAPHAQRDMDVSDLSTLSKRVCAYLGNPLFKGELLNMVFADIPRRVLRFPIVAHLTALGCWTDGEYAILQPTDCCAALPFP